MFDPNIVLWQQLHFQVRVSLCFMVMKGYLQPPKLQNKSLTPNAAYPKQPFFLLRSYPTVGDPMDVF